MYQHVNQCYGYDLHGFVLGCISSACFHVQQSWRCALVTMCDLLHYSVCLHVAVHLHPEARRSSRAMWLKAIDTRITGSTRNRGERESLKDSYHS